MNGTRRAAEGSFKMTGRPPDFNSGSEFSKRPSGHCQHATHKAGFPVCHPLATWRVQTGRSRQILSFIACLAIGRLWDNPIADARCVRHAAGCYWAMPGLARCMDTSQRIDVALPARTLGRCSGHEQADGHGGCRWGSWGKPHWPCHARHPCVGGWMTCRAKGRLAVAPSWAGRKSTCCQAVICPRLLSSRLIGDLAKPPECRTGKSSHFFFFFFCRRICGCRGRLGRLGPEPEQELEGQRGEPSAG